MIINKENKNKLEIEIEENERSNRTNNNINNNINNSDSNSNIIIQSSKSFIQAIRKIESYSEEGELKSPYKDFILMLQNKELSSNYVNQYYNNHNNNNIIDNLFIIKASNKYKLIWDFIVVLSILWTLIYIPYQLSFKVIQTNWLYILAVLIDIIFTIDTILSFFTTYYDGTEEITTFKEISTRYIQTWFIPDVLSVFPFQFFVSNDSYDSFGLIKIFRLFRLIKIVRIARLQHKLSIVNTAGHIRKHFISLLTMLFSIFFISHIYACGFNHLAICPHNAYYNSNNTQTSFTLLETLECEKDDNNFSLYLVSLYWTFASLQTIGYGDVTFTTESGRLYSIFVMFTGNILFGYMIAVMLEQITDSNPITVQNQKSITQIIKYLQKKHVPAILSKRLWRHYEYYYSRYSILNETNELLQSCPIYIRKELFLISNSEIFDIEILNSNINIIFELIPFFHPYMMDSNEILLSEDEYSSEMYFVLNGNINGYKQDISTNHKKIYIGIWLSTSYFNAICCMNLQKFSPITYKSNKITELVWINRSDIINKSPFIKKLINKKAKEEYEQHETISTIFKSKSIFKLGIVDHHFPKMIFNNILIDTNEKTITQYLPIHKLTQNSSSRFPRLNHRNSNINLNNILNNNDNDGNNNSNEKSKEKSKEKEKCNNHDDNNNNHNNSNDHENNKEKKKEKNIDNTQDCSMSNNNINNDNSNDNSNSNSNSNNITKKFMKFKTKINHHYHNNFNYPAPLIPQISNLSESFSSSSITGGGSGSGISRSNSDKKILDILTATKYYRVTKPTGRIIDGFPEYTLIQETSWMMLKRGIINPQSSIKIYYDLFIMLCTILLLITIPLRYGFQINKSELTKYYDEIIQYIFLFDLFLSFFTAYERPDLTLNTERMDIIKHYLKSWFLIDFLSAFPFNILISQHGLFLLKLFKLFRLLRITRLLKTLKISRLAKILKLSSRKKSINDTAFSDIEEITLRLISGILIISFLLHILACGWYYITTFSDNLNTWYNPDETITMDIVGKNIESLYVASLYYVSVTSFSVGYGDIIPTNDSERIFSIAVMLIGTLIVSFVVSQVVHTESKNVASFQNIEDISHNSIDKIRQYLLEQAISQSLTQSVLKHCYHVIDIKTEYSENEILTRMPYKYRIEVLMHNYCKIIHQFPSVFPHTHPSISTVLLRYFEPCYCSKDNYLYSYETGSSGYYLLHRGIFEIIDEDISGSEIILGKIYAGKIFGGDFHNELQFLGIRAANDSHLYYLSLENISLLQIEHPLLSIDVLSHLELQGKQTIENSLIDQKMMKNKINSQRFLSLHKKKTSWESFWDWFFMETDAPNSSHSYRYLDVSRGTMKTYSDKEIEDMLGALKKKSPSLILSINGRTKFMELKKRKHIEKLNDKTLERQNNRYSHNNSHSQNNNSINHDNSSSIRYPLSNNNNDNHDNIYKERSKSIHLKNNQMKPNPEEENEEKLNDKNSNFLENNLINEQKTDVDKYQEIGEIIPNNYQLLQSELSEDKDYKNQFKKDIDRLESIIESP